MSRPERLPCRRVSVHCPGMTTLTANCASGGRPPVWPLTVEAYDAVGEAGLIPEDTELMYGIVYRKTSRSSLHSRLLMSLLRTSSAKVPAGFSVRPEQPLTLGTSEPKPDLVVVAGTEDAFPHPPSNHRRTRHRNLRQQLRLRLRQAAGLRRGRREGSLACAGSGAAGGNSSRARRAGPCCDRKGGRGRSGDEFRPADGDGVAGRLVSCLSIRP